MEWNQVGEWLKNNGGNLLGLAGAVASGNVPAGVALVASMVSEATGETSPAAAMVKLQTDPAMLVKLEEIAKHNEADIRLNHREMFRMTLEDKQREHEQQQLTIRGGDVVEDEYVRHTRPLMARQSWYATMGYVTGFELMKGLGLLSIGASLELAMLLVAPAGAYLGFRTWDKWNESKNAK